MEQPIELSRKLFPLGEQWMKIVGALQKGGFDDAHRVVRDAQLSLAGTAAARGALQAYWTEYAKERLASLAGPVDVEGGVLPPYCAYRSTLLSSLRISAGGSRVIEPTIRRYVEMPADAPWMVDVTNAVRASRAIAAARDWTGEEGGAVSYEALVRRYESAFRKHGFVQMSQARHGTVFGRLASDSQWMFLFVDQSAQTAADGLLSASYAISAPGTKVDLKSLQKSAVASFPPSVLVPGYVRTFAPHSSAEMCWSAEGHAFLSSLLFQEIEKLMSNT